MSGRLVKKVLKEKEDEENQHIQSHHHHDEEENDDETQQQLNPFDLLNDDDQDQQEEDESETVDEPVNVVVPELKTKVGAVLTSSQKSKKKKKKKTKDGSSSSKSTSTSNVDEKPWEVILEALTLDGTEKEAGTKDNLVKTFAPYTLQVNPKYLNAENEMRRIFGSKVVDSIDSEKHERHGVSRLARGGRRVGHIPKKAILVTPAEHWRRWDGSLCMEFLQVTDGYHHFRYVHSPTYCQAQSLFEAAKAIHDLNGIANVIFNYPYHLDSLIAMAEYYKFVGEHQMSAECISKCLYALECAWNPMFTPLKGNCQLKYSHDTNKPLFKVLFTHMKSVERRGCHRSALEVCKLLLSLDSDDPMGAMFCIDYVALRAEEYAWLERFSEEYKSDNSLWLFPNFSYSLAICRFYLEKEESSKDARMKTAKASATDLLQQALMLHPSVLKKLVEKVPLKDKEWAQILKNAYFKADEVGIPSLDHLINIYVERSFLIWRLPDLEKLLRDAAHLVIETVRVNSSATKDWACVRKEAFSSEKNEYAHLLVSDFSLSVPSAPPEVLQQFMVDPRMREGGAFGGDPMEGVGLGGDPMGGGALDGGHAPRNVADRNALAVLLESMLPWVHYGDGNGGIDEEDQLNGHGPGND